MTNTVTPTPNRRQNQWYWQEVLPDFVKEAKEVTSVVFTHHLYDKKFDMRVQFTAATDQAKRDFPLVRKAPPGPAEYVACEGQRGEPVRVTEITKSKSQFGLSDHDVCNKCIAGDKSSNRMYDGSPCCSNAACLKAVIKQLQENSELSSEKKSILPRSAKTKEPPSDSGTTEDGCFLIIVKYKDLLSDTRMRHVFKKMAATVGYDEKQKPGKWYYLAKDVKIRFNKKELVPLDAKKVEKTTLGRVAGQKDSLYLVLAMPGAEMSK